MGYTMTVGDRCKDCGGDMKFFEVVEYSRRFYGRNLCMQCQKTARKKTSGVRNWDKRVVIH